MKTELIYFVHGTTYDNASKKCSGWKQVELNDDSTITLVFTPTKICKSR